MEFREGSYFGGNREINPMQLAGKVGNRCLLFECSLAVFLCWIQLRMYASVCVYIYIYYRW